MWALVVPESEIYKLENFAINEPRNLPLESYVKIGANLSVMRKAGCV